MDCLLPKKQCCMLWFFCSNVDSWYSRKWNYCCYVGSSFRFWYSTRTKIVYDESRNFLVSDNVNVYWNGYTIDIKSTINSLHSQNSSCSKNYLIPLILFFSITGIYVMSFNNFDIYLMIGIAVVATFLRLYDFLCHH